MDNNFTALGCPSWLSREREYLMDNYGELRFDRNGEPVFKDRDVRALLRERIVSYHGLTTEQVIRHMSENVNPKKMRRRLRKLGYYTYRFRHDDVTHCVWLRHKTHLNYNKRP